MMSYRTKLFLLNVFAVIISLTLPFFIDIPGYAIFVILGLYFLTKGLGSEIGAHRLWSHRSFEVGPVVKKILIALDTPAGEGSIIAFGGIHRLHHAHSDTNQDPHNPKLGVFKATFYLHTADYLSPKMIVDLLKDSDLMWQHQNYFKIHLILIVLLTLISPLLLWFYAVNIVFTLWINFLVDVVCHTWGKNKHNLSNNSKNNRWADIMLWGVGLHNNHHAQPKNYSNAWGGDYFDLWGSIIKLIKRK